jgi:hypothetical protein
MLRSARLLGGAGVRQTIFGDAVMADTDMHFPAAQSLPPIETIDLVSSLAPMKMVPVPPSSDTGEAAATPATSPPAADIPIESGPKGLRYDFNDGCRVSLPESDHPWRVRLSDLDTGNVLFETELKNGRINSSKRYFVRFRIDVWQNGEAVFSHDYSAAGREVLIKLPWATPSDGFPTP